MVWFGLDRFDLVWSGVALSGLVRVGLINHFSMTVPFGEQTTRNLHSLSLTRDRGTRKGLRLVWFGSFRLGFGLLPLSFGLVSFRFELLPSPSFAYTLCSVILRFSFLPG